MRLNKNMAKIKNAKIKPVFMGDVVRLDKGSHRFVFSALFAVKCAEELARLRAENKLLRQSLGIQRLLRAILETPFKPSTPRRKATKPQR